MVSATVNATIAAAYARWSSASDIEEMRRKYATMLPSVLGGFKVSTDIVAAVPGVWVENPEITTERVIIYLHGGGYLLGSGQCYAGLASRIADVARARVYLVDFALSPEAPFPTAYEQTLAVYRGLIAERGLSPERIAVVGDSAGAGLGLAVLVGLRDGGDRLPSAFAAMSPWSDLTHSGDTFITLDGTDPVINKQSADQSAATHLGDTDPTDVRASPFFADLHGLPPTLIQVGTSETLLADSVRLAEKLRGAGVDVELQVAYEMVHVFQMFVDELPQASAALTEVGRFVAARTPD
jgi:monoterpene epsilon-lactone hydrolase